MSKREKDKPRERRYIDQTSITDKGKKKTKKTRASAFHIQAGRY